MLIVKFIIIYVLISSGIIYLSTYLGYFDKPNKRGIHKIPTINTGGLVLYLSFLSVISQGEFNYNIELIVSIGLFVCLTGFVDDRINLNPSSKIILLLIPSIYLILNGISIRNLGQYEYLGILELGKFEIPFLLLAIGLLINATNYIDGIDGLTGTQFVMSFIILFFYIFIENKPFLNSSDLQTLSSLFFLVIIFLFFNLGILNSKKIFLGDAGSNFLGFVIGWILIYFSYIGIISPIMCIWIVALPCIDLLRVFIVRIANKSSPLRPDRRHIHFLLIEQKYSNINILLILSLISLFFGVIGYISVKFGNDFISLISFIFVSIAYYLFIEKYINN